MNWTPCCRHGTPRESMPDQKRLRGDCRGRGLGSAVAVALARLGIGRLIIADFDIVEPSNLNRQQYFLDQIGLPKVWRCATPWAASTRMSR